MLSNPTTKKNATKAPCTLCQTTSQINFKNKENLMGYIATPSLTATMVTFFAIAHWQCNDLSPT